MKGENLINRGGLNKYILMLRTNDFPGMSNSRWSNGRRRQLNKRILSGRLLLSSLFCILKKDGYFRGGGYFRVCFASWKKVVTFGDRGSYFRVYFASWKKVVTFGGPVTFEFILHLEKRRLLSGRQLLSSLFCILKKGGYFRGGGYFRVYFASWKKVVTFGEAVTFEFILHLE